MNDYIINYLGSTFKRISKAEARKVFCNNLPVWFCPCNLRPFGPWELSACIRPAVCMEEYSYTSTTAAEVFEKVCNAFMFYNCNNEAGRYISFYIPVCKVDFNGNKIPNKDYTYKYNDNNASYDYSILEEG